VTQTIAESRPNPAGLKQAYGHALNKRNWIWAKQNADFSAPVDGTVDRRAIWIWSQQWLAILPGPTISQMAGPKDLRKMQVDTNVVPESDVRAKFAG